MELRSIKQALLDTVPPSRYKVVADEFMISAELEILKNLGKGRLDTYVCVEEDFEAQEPSQVVGFRLHVFEARLWLLDDRVSYTFSDKEGTPFITESLSMQVFTVAKL